MLAELIVALCEFFPLLLHDDLESRSPPRALYCTTPWNDGN